MLVCHVREAFENKLAPLGKLGRIFFKEGFFRAIKEGDFQALIHHLYVDRFLCLDFRNVQHLEQFIADLLQILFLIRGRAHALPFCVL